MDLHDGFWLAAAAINLSVVWLTVPRQQIWFRRCILALWLCAGLLAFSGYSWPALAAQIASMLITASAWHQKTAWLLKVKPVRKQAAR